MKKFLLMSLFLLVIANFMFSAGQKEDDGNFVIGLSQESLDHPMMIAQRAQVMDAAAVYPDVTVIATDGQGSVVKQVAGIEDMLAQGIDLLMVQASKAEGLRQMLTRVHEMGIPFMFVGKSILGTEATTLVSVNDREIGKEIGKYVVEKLTEKKGSAKGNVVVLEGITGDQTSIERTGGFRDVIDQYPEIKVISQQPADYRRPQAYTVMQNILQANGPGTIDVVMAANGDMAIGASQAVKELNRLSEMMITGLDGMQMEIDAINAGDMTATWTFNPSGKEGLDLAVKILMGETVPERVIAPSTRIDSKNAATAKPAF
ncbi:MAG: substrate-binding domain-containing protein [Bacteroidales bacterium]|jgi:ABC-type sugar transport system substrate-binding protein|nr:substrate-binding domain-containing protein [Bacteroidales bacterium]